MEKGLIMNANTVEEEFRESIRDATFPCLGAKSALAQGTLHIVNAVSLTSAWNDVPIHQELLRWCEQYDQDQSGLRSLAVVFDGPLDLTEKQFEAAMWDRIQSFSDKDAWLGLPYSDTVSADPDDPHFSLSFGGFGFFVVGLHPNASRPARRFARPALVFNLHDQFERLRMEGKYDRMRERILDRDKALAGDINPMLARHGESSEARQYSGRAVDPSWTCPFRDQRA